MDIITRYDVKRERLWPTDPTPAEEVVTNDTNAVNLGTQFSSSKAGWAMGVRFYAGSATLGTMTGHLWLKSNGSKLATSSSTTDPAIGWHTLLFTSPYKIAASTDYVVSMFFPAGDYPDNVNYFTTDYTSGSLTAPADDGATNVDENGRYYYGTVGQAMPDDSFNETNYWQDVILEY